MTGENPQLNQQDQSTGKPLQKGMKYIWVVFPAIILAWLIYFFVVGSAIESWGARGQFGNMFGAFTALVSEFAFAGIIYAIMLQREDLGLQREELKLQRHELVLQRQELARSAEAQEQQNEALLLTAKLNSHAALLTYNSATNDVLEASSMERNSSASSRHAQALEQIIERLDHQSGAGDKSGE